MSSAESHEPDALVPVLTEVIEDQAAGGSPALSAAALEALALRLEHAVLARLGPELERIIEERFARTLSEALAQALDGVRAELTVSVTQMVREGVAASLAHALAEPRRD